ncbi:MAG: S8 family peptidase [Jatrophihabitans sp.]
MSTLRRLAAVLLVALATASGLVLVAPGAAAVPGPTAYPEYWWDQWGVPALWAAGHRGNGITVAIIDSGVQRIPELSAALKPGVDLTGLGGNGQTDRMVEAFSHGTGMASIVAARNGPQGMSGVAPSASILPIAIPLQGVRSMTDTDRTADAIDYAASHGANIISMSFGAERDPKEDGPQPCRPGVQAAVFRALLEGILLVASSGNSGAGSPVEDPSVCLGVISVAAVDSSRAVAKFSSRHRYVTVAAPGVHVLSLNRAGVLYVGDGTSQAAALTSGALALIWSAHPKETNRQIAARLMAGLSDAGPKGRDSSYGYGIINPGRSAGATVTDASPNPVFAGADPYLRSLTRSQKALPTPKAAVPATPGKAVRSTAPTRSTTLRAVAALAVAALALIVLIIAGWPRRRVVGALSPSPGPHHWHQPPTALAPQIPGGRWQQPPPPWTGSPPGDHAG